MADVILIGGGVIGLAVARRLSETRSVLLLDRSSAGSEATWAAGGMLSPQSEAEEFGPFFRLAQWSLESYPAFLEELQTETGLNLEWSTDGLLLLADTPDVFETFQKRSAIQKQAGLSVELLSDEEVYRCEPNITLPVIGALHFPGDRHLRPRQLANALERSCHQRGVEILTGVWVDAILKDASGVVGVRSGNRVFESRSVVVTAGAWCGQLKGLDPPIPVVPRKGQILSLRMPGMSFRRMVRWDHTYFIPRRNGELVVGATDEDAGYDRSPTAAGIGSVLSGAQRISAKVGSYPILETWTGLRPASPDGLPVLGEASIRGLWYATGHYRNGILLTPATAAVIAELIDGKQPSFSLEAFAPSRFQAL